MKVTGFMLKDAISTWTLRKEAAGKLMPLSFYRFPGEAKKTPLENATELEKAELAIVALQVAQMHYNLKVRVTSPSLGSIQLGTAIKLLGATNRVKKLWIDAVAPKRNRYESTPTVVLERDPTRERAEHTSTSEEITKQIALASKKVSHLGALVAIGNSTEIEIEDLDAALFE